MKVMIMITRNSAHARAEAYPIRKNSNALRNR
jgi:hypothetical protein